MATKVTLTPTQQRLHDSLSMREPPMRGLDLAAKLDATMISAEKRAAEALAAKGQVAARHNAAIDNAVMEVNKSVLQERQASAQNAHVRMVKAALKGEAAIEERRAKGSAEVDKVGRRPHHHHHHHHRSLEEDPPTTLTCRRPMAHAPPFLEAARARRQPARVPPCPDLPP